MNGKKTRGADFFYRSTCSIWERQVTFFRPCMHVVHTLRRMCLFLYPSDPVPGHIVRIWAFLSPTKGEAAWPTDGTEL
jgi:hypothetical protein